MLCKKFRELTQPEKTQFIGELNHIVMNDDRCFTAAQMLIEAARENKLLERVTFLNHVPENKEELLKQQ